MLYSKDRHRLCVIIRKNLWDKNFTHESRGQKRQKFLFSIQVKISSYTVS